MTLYPDWAEWKARTDPAGSDSFLHREAAVPSSGVVGLHLHTVAGRRYALETTTNLVTQSFAPSREDIEARGEVTPITLTNPPGPTVHYRIRLDPWAARGSFPAKPM